MLNTNYSKKNILFDENKYILPDQLVEANIKSNKIFHTGKELRLQKIYETELWKKIDALDDNISWSNKKVMDLCCGTGFVSYHILSRVKPEKMTLIDISEEEINQARSLLTNTYNDSNIEYIVENFLDSNSMKSSFDIIIGNSFLHHFYNLPLALSKIQSMLKPGGIFISLHEPTAASRAFESLNPFYSLLYLLRGERYLEDCRFRGMGIRPGHGADIWIFRDNDLVNLFKDANLIVDKKVNWHFFRTIFASIFRLHLKITNPKLNIIQKNTLKIGIKIDAFLNKYLNNKFFSSVSMLAKKPSQ